MQPRRLGEDLVVSRLGTDEFSTGKMKHKDVLMPISRLSVSDVFTCMTYMRHKRSKNQKK